MKSLLIVLAISLSFNIYALTKQEVKQTLEQMKATGMFTAEQIKEAEKKLSNMSQSDIDAMVKKGSTLAKEDPELQKKVQQLAKDPKVQEQVKKTFEEMKKKKQ